MNPDMNSNSDFRIQNQILYPLHHPHIQAHRTWYYQAVTRLGINQARRNWILVIVREQVFQRQCGEYWKGFTIEIHSSFVKIFNQIMCGKVTRLHLRNLLNRRVLLISPVPRSNIEKKTFPPYYSNWQRNKLSDD